MAFAGRRIAAAVRHTAAVGDGWRSDAATLQSLASLTFLRGVRKQANEVRVGNILEAEGRLLQVVKATHTQGHGRQLGNVQLELRDLLSKSRSIERKRPYDTVDVAFVEPRGMQYLYAEGKTCHLMDPGSYEQVSVDRDLFGAAVAYLAEGADVTVSFHNGAPIAGEVPATVTLQVAETGPYAKGDSAQQSYKSAIMENGVEVMVPPYIDRGERLVVDTRDGTFVKRAN